MKSIKNLKEIGEKTISLGYGGGSGRARLTQVEQWNSDYHNPCWEKKYYATDELREMIEKGEVEVVA